MKRHSYFTHSVVVLVTVMIVWCAVEAILQVRFRVTQGQWYAGYVGNRDMVHRMFRWHPYLAAAGRANAQIKGYSHDVLGYRNSFTLQKPSARVRIVTLGGSTTYGNYVSDADTWPAQLGRELGPRYEVYNMGMPAYSSVENIIQLALQVPDLTPRIAIFYEGWNDLHTMHVRDLKCDYSDFHGPQVLAAMDALHQSGCNFQWITFDLIGRVSVKLSGSLRDIYPHVQPGAGAWTARVDSRALGLYQRNLKTLIELSRAQKITPVMVPQVLNKAGLYGSSPSSWTPYIRERDLPGVQKVYNDTMRSVCENEHAGFVECVLQQRWQRTDFVDQGHFSAAGGRKFAHLICNYIGGPSPPAPAGGWRAVPRTAEQ